MIGIHFSGTGNTKHCVEKLVKLLDASAQSFPLEHTQMIQILEEHDIIVLGYEIKCPALLICGEQDHAGSGVRYNKAWHKNTGIPPEWIKDAGHNSNTARPETVNRLIEKPVRRTECQEA